MKEIKDSTVLVAGLGVSGRSVRDALADRVAKVVTVDEKVTEADLHSFDDIDWDRIDLVVTSPVFNPRTPFIVEAQRRGIEVISEVEVAWRLRVNSDRTGKPAPWIGITGTNGKTSTTEMTSMILTHAGYDAPAVGNIGRAVSHAVLDPKVDMLAVELSSFQLHFTTSLALECAAITNLAADHIDWHGGFDNYAADKSKVFHGVRRTLVYNADDERVSALASAAQPAPGCMRVGFTLGAPSEGMIGVERGWIVDRSELTRADDHVCGGALMKTSDLEHLKAPDGSVYPHLLADALCALALTIGAGVPAMDAVEGLKSFAPGGHRIQTVADAHVAGGEIKFIDDSKATNAHAAHASLASFPDGHVVWIAGGLAKGARFEELVRQMRSKMKAAVVIGRDQSQMRDALAAGAPDLPVVFIDPDAKDVMGEAVEAAAAQAEPGDVVLMAPACASMDQFRSYADRGDRFAAAAQAWTAAHAG